MGTTVGAGNRSRSILLGVLTLVVAFWELGAGLAKLLGSAGQIADFARWDYPPWFVYATGLLEVIAAALLLASFVAPRLALIGASLVVVTMCGAVYTRVTHAETGGKLIGTVVLLALAALVLWARRRALAGRSPA